jgi:hypothetical protein
MSSAVRGQVVHFEAGLYGTAPPASNEIVDGGDPGTGDDFGQPVPAGVYLIGTSVVDDVTFSANGTSSLKLAGDGGLDNMKIARFHSLEMTAGSQRIENVLVTDFTGPVMISGSADAHIMGLSVTGAPGPLATSDASASVRAALVVVSGAATVTWQGGTLTPGYGADDCKSGLPESIDVSGTARLSITGTVFNGSAGTQILHHSSGSLDVAAATFFPSCGESMYVYPESLADGGLAIADSVSIVLSRFAGQVSIGPTARLTVRSSTFNGIPDGLYLLGSGHRNVDLGRVDDPGHNTFASDPMDVAEGRFQQYGLVVFGETERQTMQASGNQWTPNEQGADGDGRYTGVVTFDSGIGRNVVALSAGAVINVGSVDP